MCLRLENPQNRGFPFGLPLKDNKECSLNNKTGLLVVRNVSTARAQFLSSAEREQPASSQRTLKSEGPFEKFGCLERQTESKPPESLFGVGNNRLRSLPTQTHDPLAHLIRGAPLERSMPSLAHRQGIQMGQTWQMGYGDARNIASRPTRPNHQATKKYSSLGGCLVPYLKCLGNPLYGTHNLCFV